MFQSYPFLLPDQSDQSPRLTTWFSARCPVAASGAALRQQPASCQDGERRGRGHGHPCLREIQKGEAGAGLRTSSGTSGLLDHVDHVDHLDHLDQVG